MNIDIHNNLAFLGVDDLTTARPFYETTLGFSLVAEEPGTLVFAMLGTPLRIAQVDDFSPQSFTVLGWLVADIESAAATLRAAGVEPLRYPGFPQDESGIANLGGVRIFWFTDPAGNVLSISQT